MECLLEEYFQMKVKRLLNLDDHRTHHIMLNIVFLIDMFCSFSLPKLKVVQMEIFIKETDYEKSSLISSFYYNSYKKHF